MIRLTRINSVPLVLNADLIQHIEMTPDTVVTLSNGQVFVVLESAEEIIARVREYRKSFLPDASTCPCREAVKTSHER
ncbi:MAG: flagellar FlbD family protein [Bryobacteraceae bacterium]|nr:flagellar FlbD family protein [Bryobacteraceae bacterium]